MMAGTMANMAYRLLTRMFFQATMPCRLKRTTQDRANRIGTKIRLVTFSQMQNNSPRIRKIRSAGVGSSQDRYMARRQNNATESEMIWVLGKIAWATSMGMDMTIMAVVKAVFCQAYRRARA